ncbi:MAG: hypothetical protein J3K34DRAFT_397336 [Monoraphidium minutum]|nr:MAG: hypothetical protein J3K34DRAFT_397336 [Monoraphidium minutum]
MATEDHKQELRTRLAEEKYHKSFDDLSTHEKRSLLRAATPAATRSSIGGMMGAELRREKSEGMDDDEEAGHTAGRAGGGGGGGHAHAAHATRSGGPTADDLKAHKEERKDELAQARGGGM